MEWEKGWVIYEELQDRHGTMRFWLTDEKDQLEFFAKLSGARSKARKLVKRGKGKYELPPCYEYCNRAEVFVAKRNPETGECLVDPRKSVADFSEW